MRISEMITKYLQNHYLMNDLIIFNLTHQDHSRYHLEWITSVCKMCYPQGFSWCHHRSTYQSSWFLFHLVQSSSERMSWIIGLIYPNWLLVPMIGCCKLKYDSDSYLIRFLHQRRWEVNFDQITGPLIVELWPPHQLPVCTCSSYLWTPSGWPNGSPLIPSCSWPYPTSPIPGLLMRKLHWILFICDDGDTSFLGEDRLIIKVLKRLDGVD